jgi:hypothetical protein
MPLYGTQIRIYARKSFLTAFSKKKMKGNAQNAQRLIEKINEEYKGNELYPKHLEMRKVDEKIYEELMNQFLENNYLFCALSQILTAVRMKDFE